MEDVIWFFLFFCLFWRQKTNRPAPKHKTTWQVLCQVERRYHIRESNCNLFLWFLGISPPSSNSLGLSRTVIIFLRRWLTQISSRWNQIRMCDSSIDFFIYLFTFLRQKDDRPTPKPMRQLTTWQVFCQVERRFHSQESNRQPLPWDLGISPLSSSSLGSSRTIHLLN